MYSLYAVTITISPDNVQLAYTVRPAGTTDVGMKIGPDFATRDDAWLLAESLQKQAIALRTELEFQRELQLEGMLSGIPGL